MASNHHGKPKHVVAVDVDEVLACFVEKLAHFHNETYGSSLSIHDFNSYEFRHVWGGTSEESAVKVNAFFESHHFHDLPRVPKSFDVLSELHATGHFEFVIVTSRQHKLMEHTEKWIHRHYPGIFSKMMFGNHYGETGVKRDKSAMCIEAGARILIDDSLKYAKDVSSAGIPVLLFDWEGKYPWSKTDDELHHTIKRVHDWHDIKTELLQLIHKFEKH